MEHHDVQWLRPPAQGGALTDLWAVYDGQYEEITAASRSALRAEPGLFEIIQSYATQQRPEDLRALLSDAFERGKWVEYAAGLKSVGAFYAEQGLEFHVWFVALRSFRSIVRTRLLAAYGDSPNRFADAVGALSDLVDMMLAVITEEYLRQREATIREQQSIRELSTPVLCPKPGMLVAPAVGVLDETRTEQLMERLLEAIDQQGARVVVIDVTGISTIDEVVAVHIVRTVAACRAMGAVTVLSGLSAENAIILARVGVDMTSLVSAGNLQDAIRRADALLGSA